MIDPNDEFLADWKLTTGTDFMDAIKAHLMNMPIRLAQVNYSG